MSGAPAVVVRFAQASDLDSIWEMLRALAVYEKLEPYLTGTPELLGQDLFGPQPKLECLVAERGAERIGYALFFPTYSSFRTRGSMWLEDLFVRPEARGSGAGRALMARLSAISLERGCMRLAWDVLDWNQPSIEFYERVGASRNPVAWFNYTLDEPGMKKLAGAARGNSTGT
ncbi:MAG: GNAT family N-acetyltransferase [Candidatus Eiseniibacteriota bacterium]